MGGLLCGTSAWAATEVAFTTGNTIGATDNSDGWYGSSSEIFEIKADKTLTLQFKAYSADFVEGTWKSWFSYALNFWGDGDNLFTRADGYGWKGSYHTNDNSSNWFVCNESNYGYTNDEQFQKDLNNVDVVLTIERHGTKLIVAQDFTTSENVKYRRYFVSDYGTEDGSIWCQLAIERAHLVVTADKVFSDSHSFTGTRIGEISNYTPWWTAFSSDYVLSPEQTAKITFKNYSRRLFNDDFFVAYVTTNADRGSTDYKEYMGLRADNWVYALNKNADDCNFNILDWDWADIRKAIDGATVELTVTRTGSTIKMRADITPADGSTPLYEEVSTTCGDGTQDVRVFIVPNFCSIDLLSANVGIETTIGAKDWSTFSCADYGLDFANADDGLSAYAITGHDGKKITRTAVTGAVEKNTGLLLNGEAGKTYFIPVATTGSAVSGNLLVPGTGSAVTRATGKTYYVLTNEDGVANFKKLVTDDVVIPVGKAYLRFDEVVEAREIAIDGEFTGISEIKASDMKNAEWYDLQGRRVANPVKGLYIVNGKKVILK